MAKYLFHGAYTLDGIRGVMKEGGTSRRDAVSRLIGGLGGTLESFYFAFGSDDFYITVDLPDNVTAAAIAMTVGAAAQNATNTQRPTCGVIALGIRPEPPCDSSRFVGHSEIFRRPESLDLAVIWPRSRLSGNCARSCGDPIRKGSPKAH